MDYSQLAEKQDQTRRTSQLAANFQAVRQSIHTSNEIAKMGSSEGRAQSIKRASLISKASNLGFQSKVDQAPVASHEAIRTDVEAQASKAAKDYKSMDEHKIPLENLAARFNTSLKVGLREDVAAHKNHEFGDNRLSEKKKTPWYIKLIKEMFQPFSILLWLATLLSVILYAVSPGSSGAIQNIYLAVVLIIIILATGFMTYSQSAKSEALMDSFKNMIPQQCVVIRDGSEKQIHAEKLVPGDIVLVKMGDKIPADIRIIQSREMKVDNSALTGEVEPLLRTIECTHPDNLLETKNVAFFGTLCKEGSGKGIVISIGDRTVMGQIAEMAISGETPPSPLHVELKRFVILISIIAVAMGVALFFISKFYQNQSYNTSIQQAIGIIVANVPEGLLGCITISLTITAKALAEKNVLVKNLESVETLGSTSCICSDKTGTLTQNKMTVEKVWYDRLVRDAVNRQKAVNIHDLQYSTSDQTFRELHTCTIITSEAIFLEEAYNNPNVEWLLAPCLGDASESALIKFFQPIEDIRETRRKKQIVEQDDKSLAKMPFNSTNKFSLCVVRYETDDSHFCVFIKGAPEKLWSFSQYLLVEGRTVEIDDHIQKEFIDVNLTFGKNGERVLGFAKLHLPKNDYPLNTQFNVNSVEKMNFKLDRLTFVGLVSLMDPPKESVPYAIKKCQSAGIKVIMVTGDQPPTAGAIAKKIGIITGKTVDDILEQYPDMDYETAYKKADAIVIHGDLITKAMEEERQLEMKGMVTEDMKDRQLIEWCKKPQIVFARTSPAQKLMIVRANQRLGHTCAVTGDGVNDSPAIKQGDIGISMGISGSDVTKDAADMILMDDDFASIVIGVEEGRKIFDNLKKTIVYLLTSNITEVFPYIAQIIFSMPLPLSNIFILIICIGTDILPAISFAYEEAEIDIMTRNPRKKTDHLVSLRLICHAYMLQGWIATAGGFFAYFSVFYQMGFNPSTVLKLGSTNSVPFPTLSLNQQVPQYDYTSPTLGYNALANENAGYVQSRNVDWTGTYNDNQYFDLRYIFVTYTNGKWQPAFPEWVGNSSCISSASDSTLSTSYNSNTSPCYKMATLPYAQSSYFACVVLVQWSNVFACKQRKMSVIYSPVNKVMFLGIIVETLIMVCFLYIPGLNTAIMARPLDILSVGTPGLMFSMLLMFWEEIRKYLIRNFNCNKEPKYMNWFEANSLW